MKKVILIIMFLLLCSSLSWAGVKSTLQVDLDDHIAKQIADRIYLEVIKKYKMELKTVAFMEVSGFGDISQRIFYDLCHHLIIESFLTTDPDINLFYKYKDEYEYSGSDGQMNSKCLYFVNIAVAAYVTGFQEGLREYGHDKNIEIMKVVKRDALEYYDKYLEVRKMETEIEEAEKTED